MDVRGRCDRHPPQKVVGVCQSLCSPSRRQRRREWPEWPVPPLLAMDDLHARRGCDDATYCDVLWGVASISYFFDIELRRFMLSLSPPYYRYTKVCLRLWSAEPWTDWLPKRAANREIVIVLSRCQVMAEKLGGEQEHSLDLHSDLDFTDKVKLHVHGIGKQKSKSLLPESTGGT